MQIRAKIHCTPKRSLMDSNSRGESLRLCLDNDVCRRLFAASVKLLIPFLLSASWCWPAPQTFQHDVLPLIEKNCLGCHGSAQPAAGLDLRTLAGVMAGATSGPVVVPGDPDRSRLWAMVRDGKMPKGGLPLSDEEKQLFHDWIEKGQIPTAETARAEKRHGKIDDRAREWWSFRKPVKPPVPSVRNVSKVRTPVDAFIEQKLEEKKWTIGPQAGKPTLVRRLYFDVIGLPPTPEQVSEFVNDARPDAYRRLVDRLLE